MTMIYRGFMIARVEDQATATPALAHADLYVEYKVVEVTSNNQTRNIGTANDVAIAKEMVDRLILARERFMQVVGFAI